MENNKAYLQKIHWVFLIALFQVLASFFTQPWLFDRHKSYITPTLVVLIVISAILYVALGLLTSKWKEAGIAFAAYVVLYLADHFITKSIQKPTVNIFDPPSFSILLRLIMMLLSPLPLFLFIALQSGWTKRLWLVYFINLLLTMSFSLNFYAPLSMRSIAGLLDYESRDYLMTLMTFIVRIAIFIFHVIFICELINYAKGKTYTKKPTLINLGNDYSKLNSIVTFWALKTGIVVIVLGAGGVLAGLMELTSRGFNYRDNGDDSVRIYYLCTGWIVLVSYVVMALFAAWYFRKFLIETFVSYGIHSKFLYWLCLVPIIGFFAFLILQAESLKNRNYTEKVNSLGLFAGSSTGAITGIFLVVIAIRLIMRLAGGDPSFIISLCISIGLFFWLITSKTGYLVSLWLVSGALLVIIVAAFILTPDRHSGTADTLSVLFALLIFNLIQLVLIYPIYHFEEFQYMPAEDPDPKAPTDPQFSLFP